MQVCTYPKGCTSTAAKLSAQCPSTPHSACRSRWSIVSMLEQTCGKGGVGCCGACISMQDVIVSALLCPVQLAHTYIAQEYLHQWPGNLGKLQCKCPTMAAVITCMLIALEEICPACRTAAKLMQLAQQGHPAPHLRGRLALRLLHCFRCCLCWWCRWW